MDGEMMRKWTGYEFDQWADRKGFVVVYPDGYKHNWNDCHKNATFPAKLENIDDMGFIHALIARMAQEHGIDTKHVFVLGYSNGGQMAFRLAIETPDEVAAVAAALRCQSSDARRVVVRSAGPYGARHAGERYPGPHQPI
jgi:polyhydroxybutyrate depolymerase